MKKFIYLIQNDAGMPYPELPADRCDILLLTWKEPCQGKDTLFYPGSTWNEGRNRLLRAAVQKARETGNDYLYYIFLDGDCRVTEDRELAGRLGLKRTGNPFRTFEDFLLRWEPALGYTRYDWQFVEKDAEVNLGYNIDALFNAFHRETLDVLLPYYTGFDAESWLYSQHLINHLAAMLYNDHRIQFNVVCTENRKRRGYGLRKKYWEIPTTFLFNAVRPPLREKMRVDRPNSIEPQGGRAAKKSGSYCLSPEWRRRHFDETHPFFRFRRLESAVPPPRRQLSPQDRIAVLFSGRCQGLSQTLENIRSHLLDRLGPHDVFAHIPEDPYVHLIEALHPIAAAVEKDAFIDEGDLVNGVNCRLKSGVQAYLQQLNGLKRCDELRRRHERAAGVRYRCVIRCRPDLLFLKPVDNVRLLDLNYLHVPDFHAYDGCNDRFAIGNPEDMGVYMTKIDHVHAYARDWMKDRKDALPISAEMFTAGHLRSHGICVRPLPVRFNRVRGDRVKQDTQA